MNQGLKRRDFLTLAGAAGLGLLAGGQVEAAPRRRNVVMRSEEKWPLGVFASIDAGLGVTPEIAHELGVPTIQLHAPKKENRSAEKAAEHARRLAKLGLSVGVVFGGFEGESYKTIAEVSRTVGLVPPETRAARLAEMKEIAEYAKHLGVCAVGLHVGFVPHEKSDAAFAPLVAVLRDLCDHCKKLGQNVHLETGQEPADALLQFLQAVSRDNLFVNFDPANMILYGSGEPIAALKKIGGYVRSVHCKDAKWAKEPGKEWGVEVPFGEGDVGAEAFLRTLDELGYRGPLTIEHEIADKPVQQKDEIRSGLALLKRLKAKLG